MNAVAIGLGLLAAGALLLGGKKAPPGPPGPPPYVPPPGGVENPPPGPPSLSELDQAKELAPAIESDVRARGRAYDNARMRTFQRLVRITVDGLYGPRTAGALEWALGHAAPQALYRNRSTQSYAPIKYVPASS